VFIRVLQNFHVTLPCCNIDSSLICALSFVLPIRLRQCVIAKGRIGDFPGHRAVAAERPPENMSEREARVGFPAAKRGHAWSENIQRPGEDALPLPP
jgi:hypothetical protein